VGSSALDSLESSDQKPASRRRLSPGPGMAAKDVAAHQLNRIHAATIDIVAEQGYGALRVRDVVRHAEVSTRAFYELFGSKEDCFMRTYELISRRATRRMIAAQAGEPDWRKRPGLVFGEFLSGIEENPAAAQLALIEAYAAGEPALGQALRAERIFEGMLAEAFSRSPKGVTVPPMVIEGMVAGVACVSRRHMLDGTVSQLSAASDDLVAWAISYPDGVATELSMLDRHSVWGDTTLEPLQGIHALSDGEPWPSTGDRALILAAVAELAAKHGYSKLTAPRVRSTAGVSRRKFEAYFDDLEDCYLSALEQHTGEALAQAARAQTAASSWGGGAYRAISALCDHVAGDPFLARVCLQNDFPQTPKGSRSRQRLAAAISELLIDAAPKSNQLTGLATEASTGAVWSLFHHHIVRDWSLRRQVAATLSYLALAPAIGAPAAVSAIRVEQEP
jgi:TetR/AcrR family transcriptional regulator